MKTARRTAVVATSLVCAYAAVAPAAPAQLPELKLPKLPVDTPTLPSTGPTPTPRSLPAPIQAPLPAPVPLPAPSLPPSITPIAPALPTPVGPGPGPIGSAPGAGDIPLPGGGGLPGVTIAPGAVIPGGTGGSLINVASTAQARVRGAAAQVAPGRRFIAISRGERRRANSPFWRERLRGKRLRDLRDRVLAHWSCADAVPASQRRALVLRAGLFGRQPASWRAIARRMNVSLARAVRLGRSGLKGITSARMCIETGGAALGTSADPIAISFASTAAGARASDAAGDDGGVLGVQETRRLRHTEPPDMSHGGTFGLGRSDEGGPGIPDALFALLVALLWLMLAAVFAIYRRGALPLLPPVPQVGRSGKPLLFLDVDGVIALSPFAGPLPPGRWHDADDTQVYVAEQSGDLVRRLAERYEIVWASGWGKDAGRFSRVLGLEEEAHALTFGRDARSDRSDWKIKWVQRAAGKRPLAWVDDTFGSAHIEWGTARDAPTLLVRTTPHVGLAEDHVRELLDWADTLDHAGNGRFVRGRNHHRVGAGR